MIRYFTFQRHSFRRGFTLFEMLIVIAISLIVFSSVLTISFRFQTGGQLGETVSRLVQQIRSIKNDSEVRFNAAPHGIFFEVNPTSDDRYILYEGVSYVTRNTAEDIIITLDSALSLSTTIVGGDLNFSQSFGIPNATGTVTVNHSGIGESRVITVNGLGAVDFD